MTRDEVRGIRVYFWAEDNRHVLYLQDSGGTRTGACTPSTRRAARTAT
ncbi:hypothetical protein [Rubrobacter marinus]|nr:hypothetical protein [Rubrobacter marinus]